MNNPPTDTTRYSTRHLPACSEGHQPIALPHTPDVSKMKTATTKWYLHEQQHAQVLNSRLFDGFHKRKVT